MTKTLPGHPSFEAFCLANAIFYPEDAEIVFSKLKVEDFTIDLHILLFSNMEKTVRSGQKINFRELMVSLSPLLNGDQIEAFLRLKDNADKNAPITRYVDKIKTASDLRKLYFVTLQASQDILNKEIEPSEISNKILDCVNRFEGGNQGGRYAEDIIRNFEGKNLIDVIQERMHKYKTGEPLYSGVKSYYPLLDNAIGSFRNGTLTYIGARTNTGKTTFILNIMSQILFQSNHRICFFSAEVIDESILEKFICLHLGISLNKYLHGQLSHEEFIKVHRLCDTLQGPEKSGRFIINDSPITTASLAAKMRKYVKIDGSEIIFIDYLSLIKAVGKTNNMHEKVSEVSKELQRLSKELKVPIVCLAQLNRGAAAKAPSLADFRESGSIEEDCDVAILLYQQCQFDKTCQNDNLSLVVAKNRIMSMNCKIEYGRDSAQPGKWIELESLESIKNISLYNQTEPSNSGLMA